MQEYGLVGSMLATFIASLAIRYRMSRPKIRELLNDWVDETPWYEKGKYRWLWVAITSTIAVFHIGSRCKEELLRLISEAFVGWLVPMVMGLTVITRNANIV